MQTKTQALVANKWIPLTVNGTFFMLLEAAGPLDIEFQTTGASGDMCEGVEAGFSIEVPGALISLRVRSATAQTIKWVYGSGRARFDRSTLVSQSAASLVDLPPVTVGTGPAPDLIIAAGFRRSLALRNTHSEPLYLCGAAGSTASAGYELQPGDVWEAPSNLVCCEIYGLFVAAAGPVAVMPGV